MGFYANIAGCCAGVLMSRLADHLGGKMKLMLLVRACTRADPSTCMPACLAQKTHICFVFKASPCVHVRRGSAW